MKEIKIEKGHKIPTRHKWDELIGKMNHGDSVVIPTKKVTGLKLALLNKGFKVVMRKENDTNHRVWKVNRDKK